MVGGDRFTASFTIPATYVGGTTGASPNRALPVRPGDHYAFATYPAGICDVPLTVTGGIRTLAISHAVLSEWTAAYAGVRQISPLDIAGTKVGSGPWQAQIGGEPVYCLEERFYPRAVLTAWALPADPATAGEC
jgi:hypothetical protein